jgi:RNA polymerase sigma factor (sigma-70 family)
MEQQELSETVLKAIASLPEQQNVAFTLHKIDGKSYKEISEIMNKSTNSIESLMHRAKHNLQIKLGNFYQNNL